MTAFEWDLVKIAMIPIAILALATVIAHLIAPLRKSVKYHNWPVQDDEWEFGESDGAYP